MRHSINNTAFSASLLGVALAAAALLASAACSGNGQPSGEAASVDSPLISVVTTLYPLEYFARRVAGDSAEVVNLFASGAEAHDFEPSPGDIRLLRGADVVIYNGAGLEPWLDRALRALPTQERRIVVEASRGVAQAYGGDSEDAASVEKSGVIEDPRGRTDPHVWLDPLKAAAQVSSIRDGLLRADPGNRSLYDENASRLIEDLLALDGAFTAGLASCDSAHFATSHDAFGYLARRYRIEVVPISGLSPEVVPAPRELARLTDRLKALGVAHIMIEPGVSTRLADTVAKETGATLLTLHPLESLTPTEAKRLEDYFSLMQDNLANLRLALGCGK